MTLGQLSTFIISALIYMMLNKPWQSNNKMHLAVIGVLNPYVYMFSSVNSYCAFRSDTEQEWSHGLC